MSKSSSLSFYPGPLFQLQWKGRLCSCWEKEEDRQARDALEALLLVGRKVRWFPPPPPPQQHLAASAKAAAQAFRSMVGGLFRESSSSSDHDTESSEQENGHGGLPLASRFPQGIPARLVLRDRASPTGGPGIPELVLIPLLTTASEVPDTLFHDEVEEGENRKSSSPRASAPPPIRRIRLHRIGSLDLDPSTHRILIKAKRYLLEPVSTGNGSSPPSSSNTPPPPLLCSWQLLQPPSSEQEGPSPTAEDDPSQDTLLPASDQQMFMHHLSVLMEWERQRREKLRQQGVEEEEDDDDDDVVQNQRGGNFLTRRARTAAHFARREIELQQVRRQREQRKNKLIQQTGGGLKYTALAMAQNAANQQS